MKKGSDRFSGSVLEVFITLFGVMTIVSLLASLIILSGITGSAVGSVQDTYYGIIVVIFLFIVLCVIIVLKHGYKKNKVVDLKKLIQESQIKSSRIMSFIFRK